MCQPVTFEAERYSLANKEAIIQSNQMTEEQKVTALLMCIAQEKKVEFTRAIQPQGLSLVQLSLLHVLDWGPAEGLTVNQLKSAMIDESPNVSRALNKLVDAGYAEKRRDQPDQRIVHIVITDAGRHAHKDADQNMLAIDSLPLSDREITQLYQLLKKL